MASLGIVSDKARYHAMPLRIDQSVRDDRDMVERCSSTRGHILRVREKEIYCERCPAVWKDEGF